MSISEQKSNQAKTYYSKENYSEAIKLWTEAIDLSGSDDPIQIYYSNKCACNLKLNNINEALYDAEACTKYAPTWSKGFIRLGGCYERLRRFPEALAAFERANELEPNNSDTTNALNRIQRHINGHSYSIFYGHT
jgi:tetratricopeptide (TPR) repeat protein